MESFFIINLDALRLNLYQLQGGILIHSILVTEEHQEVATQSAFTCSKLTTETLEQGVKYVQS